MFRMDVVNEALKKEADEVSKLLRLQGRDELIPLFEKCYPNTLDTTVKILADGSAYVITGDIHAMWLRDSAAQVHHYLPLAKKCPDLAELIASMIRRYALYVNIDPYANAFNENGDNEFCGHYDDITDRSPWVFERKYEVDSLCSVINISYLLWKETGTVSHFTNELKKAFEIIVDLWKTEQYHSEKSTYKFERPNPWKPTDTLTNNGKGSPVAYTGMTWSGFRPSDDACTYHYLIPSEMFAVVVLRQLASVFEIIYNDPHNAAVCNRLSDEIDNGIKKHGVIRHPEYGEMYAYEVDGLGNYLLMDDANVPSLLSMPYIGYCDVDDRIYQNTRRFVLSEKNPFYYTGSCMTGIGSPHTEKGFVWPISLVIQALTSNNTEEIEAVISMIKSTHADTLYMHESINANNQYEYTRDWFAWANSLFSELILKCVGRDK